MKVLENQDLINIKGGSNTWWFSVGAFITFFLGLFHGIVNTRKCYR